MALAAHESSSTSAWDTSKAHILNRFGDEANRFEHVSLEDLLKELTLVEDSLTTRDSSHRFVNIFQNFIFALSNYGRALDTFAQVDTLLFTPIWGSIRVIIQAAANFREYIDRLLQMIRDLTDNLPRFDGYGELFSSEKRLQSALVKTYCDALEFCIAARNVFAYEKNSGRRWLPRPFRDPAIKSLWKDFELQYGAIVASFKHNSAVLEHEAQACGLKVASNAFNSAHVKLDDLKRIYVSHMDAFNLYQERWIFAWLNAPTLNEELYAQYCRLRLSGTCQWILHKPDFVTHLNENPSSGATFWLTGIPGTGKSVLCSSVIKHMKNNTQGNVTYFFCSDRDTRMCQAGSVCRSLVSQLLVQDKNKGYVWTLVSKAMEKRRDLPVAGEDVVWTLLFQICSAQPTDIIIDGFDECLDGRSLLDHIMSLGSVARVTIFSRKTEIATPGKLGTQSLVISRADVDADIDFMIRSSLTSCSLASTLDPYKLDEVRAKVLRRSDGVFICAKLAIDELCQLQTVGEIDKCIEFNPDGVSAMYHEALKRFRRLPTRQRVRTLDLVGWVTVARRSLKLTEIEDALIITPDTERISGDDRILSIRSVIDTCSPLIDIDPCLAEVRYCHYSFKEFILGLSLSDALDLGFTCGSDGPLGLQLSSRIGILCLRYLQMPTLQQDWVDGNSSKVLLKKYPLLEYAVCYWLDHMLDGKPDLLPVEQVRSFMESEIACKWLQEIIRIYQAQLGHYHYGPLIMALERRLNDWVATVLLVNDKSSKPQEMSNFCDFKALLGETAIKHSVKYGAQDLKAIEAYRALYLHYTWRGNLSEADKTLHQILDNFDDDKSVLSEGMYLIFLDILFDLSQVRVSQGRLGEAEEIIYEVYEGRKRLLEEDSIEVAEAAGALADILTDMDRLEEAEPLHRHALKILILQRGERSLDTAFQYNNLGNCLCQLGMLQEAKSYLQKALQYRQAALGSRSHSTLRTLDCLGVVLRKNNDLHGAYHAHATAFKGLQDVVGTSHFFTWRAAYNLSIVEFKLGSPRKAISLALQALESLEEILGPSALDTISAADLAAELLNDQDEMLSFSLVRIARDKAVTSLGNAHALTRKLQATLSKKSENGSASSRDFNRSFITQSDRPFRTLIHPGPSGSSFLVLLGCLAAAGSLLMRLMGFLREPVTTSWKRAWKGSSKRAKVLDKAKRNID